MTHPAEALDRRRPLDTVQALPDGGWRIGALSRDADVAHHPALRAQLPLLSAALLADPATQEATFGARVRGSAVDPCDMCVALAALNAVVHVRSPRGERGIPFADFLGPAGERAEVGETLARDEQIEHIDVPPSAHLAPRSAYLRVRERQSLAFAAVSVAAALDIGADGRIRDARLVIGGVAHEPWRDAMAEGALLGHPAHTAVFEHAAAVLFRKARARGQGVSSMGSQIELARRAIVRALTMAARGEGAEGGLGMA